MHGRTYKKYYFKITIFVQNKTYLYKINKKSAKIKHKINFFFKYLSKNTLQNSWFR
jgi:hypothetical protein